MNSILDPFLAILAIVIPMGLAYIVITLQARRPPSVWLNVSANIRDKLLQQGAQPSRVEEKHAAR
jgi:hypothetical protein